jgi:hypothetical protein
MDPTPTDAVRTVDAALERRVMSLETRLVRATRVNRLLLIALIGVAGTGLFGAAAADQAGGAEGAADVVRAHRFEVLDRDGNVRAEVGIDDGGSAGLFLRDDRDRVRAALVHDAVQSALYMFDPEGTIRLGAAQYAHGGGGFALHGPRHAHATVLHHKGGGSLTFYGERGEVLRTVQPFERTDEVKRPAPGLPDPP